MVYAVVQSTAEGDDEPVIAHPHEHQKIRNIRRDPRVAVTVVSTDRTLQTPYLSIKGTARLRRAGWHARLAHVLCCPSMVQRR
ncbi:MAG TPA: pyridoxamine 5'-phosphate oxidase family protein [Mycobacterium sp.]|uniref:pyridoxamine 5'-phosphate oxidase family protein n=1 Tax=Mycobacterium sp. TaxID=1785 RepID=UPI002D59D5D1|nr:pyridoxamine 5'-phosphate oxidase family protein [Mycobacterium sp.]HZU48781.1 pyridoxamine 5'-phosphate oxidase family protein [Mycobacterium sp.]